MPNEQQIKPKGKVFRDPVHRLIRIEPEDQFILDLINTPEFQRLRRVRQLGVSGLTYHGAEHSRFAHSLGVFNFCQRIAAALQRRYGADSEVARYITEHSRVVKAAALLHDVGHGPFSHMIERATGASFDHEQMTSRLIREKSSRIRQALEKHDLDPESVADVIAKIYPHQLIVDIVSSQLDADRMDYLLRDSMMTGVEYGVFDGEWLLNAMCVGLDPTAAHSATRDTAWRLCLDRDRGLYAAEQLILARHHMMPQVYMHRVTRGYEVLLLMLFERAAALASEKKLPAGTPPVIVRYFESGIEMSIDDWTTFDEASMIAAIQAWSCSDEPDLGEFARAFLRRERVLRGYSLAGLRTKQIMDLPSQLEEAGLRKGLDWELDDGKHLPYKGILAQASKGDVEESSSLSILLADGDVNRRGTAIESLSTVFKALDNTQDLVSRVYIRRTKFPEAEGVLKRVGLKKGDGE